MKAFPPKDPEEILDYSQHFAALLESGLDYDTVTVTVESCDPAEDVFSLEVTNTALAEDETAGQVDTVVFWLKNGTLGTKYVLKTVFSDSENGSEDRTFVRRSSIKIGKQ